MMDSPSQTLELHTKASHSPAFAIGCMDAVDVQSNAIYVGGEDGHIAHTNLHGSTTGIDKLHKVHSGYVTGISSHPSERKGRTGSGATADFTDVLLSCAVDWSVKLTVPKLYAQGPLLAFEAYEDYVTDVKW